ncbi:hypothetical protein LOTGIDRAFT_167218 [Lottia gigantea]|uniref:Uncharacterized protein n=1 Tax=Lottia gigantea TaxID=225164 RepID=V3Z6K8_LOTGI|nr:hypothetical protein LOTGIDRAFT_167218 [Lottia gigantea]ESO86403.1 hypothetical protein LOTGIDRAFT_167218 [Lottia gigantea]
MDFNQQELELNEPVQSRDRSSRCHSRLADALVFAASNPERPESSPERLTGSSYEAVVSSEQPPLKAASVDMSSRSDTVHAASAESLIEIADSDHPPRRTASDIETVAMPDYKTSVSRTYSETDKAHLPANRLDIISGIGSALASPEPSLFTMAYRIKDSPSPFKASPLPPIKGSQLEQELKLQQQQLDNIKNIKKFDYFEIGLETSDAELDKKKHKKFDYFEIGLESEPEMESNQQVHELKIQEHQIDNNKNKKAFEYFEIDMGTSHVEPKTSDKKKNKKFVRFEIDMETSHVEHKSWEKENNLYEDLQIQDRDRVEDQLNNLDVNEKNDLKSRPVVAEDEILNYESVQMEKNQLAETDYKNTEDVELKSWEKENNLYEDLPRQDRDRVEDQLNNLAVNEKNDLKSRPVVAEDEILNYESVQMEKNQLAETDYKNTEDVELKSWEKENNLYEDLPRQDRDRVEDQLNNLAVNEKNDLKSRPVVAEDEILNYESFQMEKNQLAETDYKNTEDVELKSWEKENNLYEDVQIYDRDIVEDQLKNLDVNEENDLKPRPAVAEEKTLNPESVQIETNQLAETDYKEDVTQTLTKVIEKLDDLLSMSKSDIQVHPPRYPKPPNVSKGQIIVRGTKASRLRQDKLRVQNEESDVTLDVLPAVATPDKTLERRTLVKSNPPRSRTSPPPTTKKKPVPPPVLAVRETKATKLRRLKKMEEEREAKGQNHEEKLKDMAFDQSLVELLHRKRTPTPTFKPAPPKPYKKPGPVSIKETRASKMRKIQENLKKTGKTVAANEIKSQDRSQKQPPPTNVKETLASKSRQARSPAPTFKPAPPKPYKKPGPVSIKETRASKMRKIQENLKKTGKTVAANKIKSQDRSQKQPPPTNVKETLASKSRQARSPAPTFKPAPPKPYKKPGPVVVKETRASKLRKMPENIKRADNKVPIKSNKTSEVSKKRPLKKQPQGKPLKNELVSSLTPLTPHRLPPIPQNGTKSITGDERDATPVILKELRESRRYYEENIENEDLVTTPIVKWSGSRTLLWLIDCPSDNVSESSHQSTDSSPGEFDDDVSESSYQSTDSSPGESHEDISESSYQSTDSSPGESDDDISESSYQSTDSSPGESTDDVSESSDKSTDTSSSQTDVWDGEFDPVAIKYYRSLTPVHIEWKPPPKKRILSPISRVGCGKVSNAVSPSWRIESPLMTSTPFPRKDNEKDEKFLDRSARDKLCRMEVSRGFKVRKEIRMAMDEQGMQWESEFKSDIKITEETYRVQRSVDSNKQMVQNELDGLRERLRQAEEKDKLKSKDKSFCSSKFKTYFKSKKAGSDEKKERKETMDEYFRKTEEKFSRYVSSFLGKKNKICSSL